MNFCIGIPTINRADLLIAALEIYYENFPNTNVYVIDNGAQDIPLRNERLFIIRASRLSVAESWNLLCMLAFEEGGHEAIDILNDDDIWDATEEKVNTFLEMTPAEFYYSMYGWCNFFLRKSTYEKVGPFDENFKGAYFEDNDYSRRLTLAGVNQLSHKFFNPVIHRVSESIAKDGSLNVNFASNQQYYQRKWGNLPGEERYLKPFNGLQ